MLAFVPIRGVCELFRVRSILQPVKLSIIPLQICAAAATETSDFYCKYMAQDEFSAAAVMQKSPPFPILLRAGFLP